MPYVPNGPYIGLTDIFSSTGYDTPFITQPQIINQQSTSGNRTAPSYSTPARTTWNTVTSPKSTTVGGTGSGSLSWNTGDYVYVIGMTADQSTTLTVAGPASLNAFTSIAGPITTGSSCWIRGWVAVANANGSGAITGTATGGASDWGLIAYLVDGTTSDGTGNVSAPAASSTQTLSLNKAQSNSAVIMVIGDWGAGVGGVGAVPNPRNWTPSTTLTEREAFGVSGLYNGYAADWSDAGSAGSTTYGISVAASGSNYSRLAIEILGKAAAGVTDVFDSETSTGTDSVSSLSITATETSTGSDSVSAISVTATETSTGSDSASLAVSLTATETSTSNDAVSALDVSLTVSETGIGTEGQSLFTGGTNVSDSDTSPANDAVSQFARTVIETGASTETVSNLTRPVSEIGSTVDSASLSAALNVSETGTGIETTTVFTRTGITETGSGSENVSTLDRAIGETGSSSENATVAVSLTASETSSSIEAVTSFARTGINETGTGIDTGIVGSPISDSETSTSVDIVSARSTQIGESGLATETATLVVNMFANESVIGIDSASSLSVTLSQTETGHATESATAQDIPLISWSRLNVEITSSTKSVNTTTGIGTEVKQSSTNKEASGDASKMEG